MVGFLKHWGCDLNPLLMVAVIMAAGLGVDFSVHIIFHYVASGDYCDKKAERIRAAFNACGLAMLQVTF